MINKIWPCDPDKIKFEYPYGLIHKEGEYFEINRINSSLNHRERNQIDELTAYQLTEEQKQELLQLCGEDPSGFFLYDDRTDPIINESNFKQYFSKLHHWRKILYAKQ